MNNLKYVVVVVEDETGKFIHSICGGQGVSKDKAERIMAGASINLDHYKYSLRMIPCVPDEEDEDEC
jgi:hypothetical protein